MADQAIAVSSVFKTCGKVVALSGVDLEVAKGSIVGLVVQMGQARQR